MPGPVREADRTPNMGVGLKWFAWRGSRAQLGLAVVLRTPYSVLYPVKGLGIRSTHGDSPVVVNCLV